MSFFNPRTWLALAVLAALSGCAAGLSTEHTLAKRLSERGPVALSADNPFIASNLLLTKEMERSPELKGFIEHRGRPDALEVERGLMGSLAMTLFYSDRGERYGMEFVDGTWIISTALPVSGEDARRAGLALTSGGSNLAPEAHAHSGVDAGSPALPAGAAQTSPASENLAPPTLVVAGRIDSKDASPSDRAMLTTAPFRSPAAAPEAPRYRSPREIGESRADLLFRLIAAQNGDPAEISPRGDLVHYVTNPRETIDLIAEWYTDSPLNGARVRRMNALAPRKGLAPGDTIVIPRYLVTNKNRLSDDAIERLSAPAGAPNDPPL